MITRYLHGYNLLSLLLWMFLPVWFWLQWKNAPEKWIIALLLIQGLALFEIIHVVAGWVKTSLTNTVVQYCSRMFIAVLLYFLYLSMDGSTNTCVNAGTILIFIAWPLAEIIRYAYYLNGNNPILKWLRYTAFIILYPIGVLAESFILIRFLNWSIQYSDWIRAGIISLSILMYIFFFPKLYGYLWQQRKNKL